MTLSQVDLYLHLATRGEERRASIIGFKVAEHVAGRLGF
jgi:hypothetical protein